MTWSEFPASDTAPGPKPGVKVDARSERWREHRKKVRSEIVEAAFRAIDRLGPNLSVREIAEEAGTAKPKIYRHFTDKSDLFQAIGERLRDMLWAAVFPSIDFATNSVREIIKRSAEEYVNLVDEHPNVLRFFIQGRFPEQSESTMRTVNEGREITLAMAEMFNNELREMELDPAAFELAAFAAYGCAGGSHRLVARIRCRQPAADAPRPVRRASDHDHAGRHRRHRRDARHQAGPRQAHSRRDAAQLRRQLASGSVDTLGTGYLRAAPATMLWGTPSREAARDEASRRSGAMSITESPPNPMHRRRPYAPARSSSARGSPDSAWRSRCRSQGVDFVIVEKADDVGGTWRDNSYPGCACDVPSHLYSFSFEPKATWSKLFSPQPEILDYLKDVTEKYGLRRYIRFGQKVKPRALG